MFTPGHLHRDNLDRPESLRLAPPFSVDFYYQVLCETNGMMMVAVSGTAAKMG